MRLFLLTLLATGLATQIVFAGQPQSILIDTPNHVQPEGGQGKNTPVVMDVVLHKREDILRMLKRAEELAMTPNPIDQPRQISLVLHGMEIEHFKISEYENNRDIVDLAAKLDAFNVIDIKMCNMMMDNLNIPSSDIPAFIDVVPYGPAEVELLQKQGFIKL